MTADYLLCGWKLRSDIPMPELRRWSGDARPADVHFRLGDIPELPGTPSAEEMGFHLQPNGDCLLQIAGVARFRVRDGAEVVVRPQRAAADPGIRVYLLGSVLGFLCHQRGVLPLHASCIRIGDRAVAICAPSGTGKSTLAAALVARGHGMMADDLLVIAPGQARVAPSFPRLKLSPEAAVRLGFDPATALAVPSEVGKLHLPVADFNPAPAPLAAVVRLRRTDTGTETEPAAGAAGKLTGMAAVIALQEEVFRREMARMAGLDNALFRLVTGLARQVPVFSLPSSRQWDGLPRLADRIEVLARGDG